HFFFNHPPPPATYTLSLHDALPIYLFGGQRPRFSRPQSTEGDGPEGNATQLQHPMTQGLTESLDLVLAPFREGQPEPALPRAARSEEHTSELQSRSDLVCRLLLEKK